MKPSKLDHIWNQIEDDLLFQYDEYHRDALQMAIQNLPTYLAPDSVWTNIEKNIDNKSLVVRWKNLLLVAAILVMLLSASLWFQQLMVEPKVLYTKANLNEVSLTNLTDTSSSIFKELKEATCSIKPSYCLSDDFIQAESEYNELLAMQEDILKHANVYDNGDQMEMMMLKLEDRKKTIEQELIAQLN